MIIFTIIWLENIIYFYYNLNVSCLKTFGSDIAIGSAVLTFIGYKQADRQAKYIYTIKYLSFQK